MNYYEIPAEPPLAKYIECYWVVQSENKVQSPAPERIVPDGCVELIFNFADPFDRLEHGVPAPSSGRSYVGGQLTKNILIIPTGIVSLLGVRLNPGGVFSVLGVPAHELTDRIVPLASIWGALGTQIENEVLEAKSVRAKIKIIERILIRRIANRDQKPCAAVETAVNMIVRTDGLVTMDRLTKTLGLAPRQLQRKFKENVGIPAKLLARIIRFQKIFKHIERKQKTDWAATLYNSGYYDQSHFIHEFKTFSGESPSNYLKEEQLMADFFKRKNRKVAMGSIDGVS